ncbi:MAG: methyltransferase [Pseudopedobacter saltans]|uniref:Methyltransferase n=1 Tax=Pseudopedobacter saltans TaxID=151895 RepID=A0A2W5ESC2_9SPHI|nr:MAG: methyltransferase [Pseudopedobacter saltans]
MDLINPIVEQYAEGMTSRENDLLSEIDKQTNETHAHPHMLSGHVQGRFLSMLSQLLRPRYILEIGTFTGYSALCMAEGLTTDGELHTIDIREEDVNLSRSYFDESKYAKQIISHTGNALEIIPLLNRPWDLVFIDADKVNYINYYNLVLDSLSENGCILADNVLFHGQIFEDPTKGKSAIAIKEFNDYVKNDPRTTQVLITVRDGLLLIKKNKNA